MDLHSRCFNIVAAVSSPGEISEIKLYLIPSTGETDGHRCTEWSDPCRTLEIANSKPSVHILVIEDLILK